MHIAQLGPQRLTLLGKRILLSRGINLQSQEAASQKIPRAEDVASGLPPYFGTAIDPEGAYEIDDAFMVEETTSGFTAWIHIANPTAFINIDSPIDLQARELTASTYGGDIYLPMLPAHLVEQATLTQGQLRPAITVHLNFDQQGNLLSTEIIESAFTNKLSLSYQEADRLLDSPRGEEEIIASLRAAKKLTALLRHKLLERIKGQSDAMFDNDNVPSYLAKQYKSYLMVSQLMIVTNNAIAQYLNLNGPSIYRCHQLALSSEQTPYLAPMHKFLTAGNGNHRAYYSPINTEHEGLGLNCYVHFTSPLRRYADMLIHHILKRVIKTGPFTLPQEAEARLAKVAEHLTIHPYEIQGTVGELLARDLLEPVPEVVAELLNLSPKDFSKELAITLLAGNSDISNIIAAAKARELRPEDIVMLLRFIRDHKKVWYFLLDFCAHETNFDYVKTLKLLATENDWPLSMNKEKFDIMIGNDFYTTSSRIHPDSKQQAARLLFNAFVYDELELYNPLEELRTNGYDKGHCYKWQRTKKNDSEVIKSLLITTSTGEAFEVQGKASPKMLGCNDKAMIYARRAVAEAAIAELKRRNLW